MEKPKPADWKAITPESWIEPYEYIKIFAPKPAAQLERIIGRVAPAGGGDSPSRTAPDKDDAAKTAEGKDDGEAKPSVSSLING